jgi:hypothetical protein
MIKRLKHPGGYIFAVAFVLLASFSVYLFLGWETVAELGREDHLFEWLTSIAFLIASVLFFLRFLKRKNVFFLLLSAMFFLGFGEEISWGQRVLNFETPERVLNVNVQNEFNLHNIELFNREDHEGNRKTGLARLLEVNLLFKVFIMMFGIALPLAVILSGKLDNLARRIGLPVPPLSLGIFFMINWLVYKAVSVMLPGGLPFQFYDTNTEIFEFVAAFVMLVISLYFYKEKETVTRKDAAQPDYAGKSYSKASVTQ